MNPSFLFLPGEVEDFISDPVKITDFGCRRQGFTDFQDGELNVSHTEFKLKF